jgi:hypothetical protein
MVKAALMDGHWCFLATGSSAHHVHSTRMLGMPVSVRPITRVAE